MRDGRDGQRQVANRRKQGECLALRAEPGSSAGTPTSVGSPALHGGEKIMVCRDNAAAPADTKGSPRPIALVMKNEYLAHCPLIPSLSLFRSHTLSLPNRGLIAEV